MIDERKALLKLAKWDVNRLPAIKGMTINDYILLLIKQQTPPPPNGNRRNPD
jgi:hypothetical protein